MSGTDYQSGQIVLTSGTQITDTDLFPIDTGGAEVAATRADALAQYTQRELFNLLPPSKLTSQVSTTTTQVGGITGALTPVALFTGTVAPVTVYFPPATEIYAAAVATGLGVGDNYAACIVNTLSTTGVMTMGASAGITLNGLATLTGQNSYATFNINIVSATAVTITRVG